MTPEPGDIGLSGVKAQGVVSLAIRLGSVLRHEKSAGMASKAIFVAAFVMVPIFGVAAAIMYGKPLAALLAVLTTMVVAVGSIVLLAAFYGFRSSEKQWFSHSFIVHHLDHDGTVWISESVGTGARTVHLHYKPGDYVWLKTSALLTGDDVEEMRVFLDAVTTARWKYDYGTFAGLAIYAITGAMFAPAGVGTAICSGLTSEALTRGRAIWPFTAYRMMPQDQFWFALSHGIAVEPTG